MPVDNSRWDRASDDAASEEHRAPGRRTMTAGLASHGGHGARPPSRMPSGAREVDVADEPGRLPADVGASMGAAFGLDLSRVNVVTDSAPASSVGARAFASQGELHFAPRQYDPASRSGLELIGHEVAHLAQQAEGRVTTTAHAKGVDLGDSPALEAEADDLGRRAAQGETNLRGGGVLRTPLTSATAVQRKQTQWTDIGENGRGVIWDPHRTDINGQNEALGTGGAVVGLSAAPATSITYTGAGGADLGQGIRAGGLGVDAAVLGPTHPKGAPPAKWTTPAGLDKIASTAAGLAAQPVPPPYKAIQLLPERLGGIGTTDNLVAVPPAVELAIADLHDRAYRLVHGARTFIKYLVKVTEANDAAAKNAPYAARIELSWSQLQNSGAAVADATGTINLDVPSPTAVGGGTAATENRPAQNPGTMNANQAVAPAASTKKHAQARAEFRTHITFGGLDNGDGTRMEAHRLGPDHGIGDQPAGDTPNDKKTWNKRTKELEKATGNVKTYVAGHLLNHHIGGLGDDERNLVAIPADANDLHESQVESVIKNLVNQQGAWVYYKVEAVHDDDVPTGTRYAKAFACTWWQLDTNGEPVPGTKGQTTINIPPPSSYKVAPIPPKKKEASLATPTVGTVDGSGGVRQGTTAHTVLGYDEVLLEDRATLKHQITVMKPLVEKLKALDLAPAFANNGALATDLKVAVSKFCPDPVEAKAQADLEKLAAELKPPFKPTEVGAKRLALGALKVALGDLIKGTSMRHKNANTELLDFFQKHFNEPKAKNITEAIDGALRRDSFLLGKTVTATEGVISFAEFSLDQLESNRGALFGLDQRAATWSGKPPSDKDAEPAVVEKATWANVGFGVSHVVDAVETPRSPMQQISVAEEETGMQFDGAHDASRALAKRRGEVDQPPPTSSVPPSRDGANRLIALTRTKADKWPKWKPSDPGVDAVAIAIETLVNGLPVTAAALPLTITSLYQTSSKAVMTYLEWVESELAKL